MRIHIERDGMILDWEIAEGDETAVKALQTVAALATVLFKDKSVADSLTEIWHKPESDWRWKS